MTPPDKLMELAARVEAATGPDRELDGAIDCLFNNRPKNGDYNAGENCIWRECDGHSGLCVRHDGFARDSFCARKFTASLDAAMTLVPEGWYLGELTQCNEDDEPQACLTEIEEPYRDAGAIGATITLALVAAALKARAQSAQERE